MLEQNSVENRLLCALPSVDYERLAPYLISVELHSGTIIYEPGQDIEFAYFPCSAMISIVSIMEDGATTEIGLIGNEGMIGLPIILGGKHHINQAIVQIPGTALKLKDSILKQEFQRSKRLQKLLFLYIQARLTQVSQTAACNRQHKIEQRLARWLLSAYDCLLCDEIPLTQEFIANMLGIRRSGVTTAAKSLQDRGVIRYNRGKIKIVNQKALENASCECYRLVKDEFFRLLGTKRG
ncbi:MAG: Crp/Fnr family transcriptional regulator [Crocosphaera sp.]|nr:Crp/Fnr family transcriptional regulator [Crocosphaera sp.]